jgi:hypothetical protein
MAERQVVLQFDTTMHSIFVSLHDGRPLMMPVDVEKGLVIAAVPVEAEIFSTQDVEEVCAFIRGQYALFSKQQPKQKGASR